MGSVYSVNRPISVALQPVVSFNFTSESYSTYDEVHVTSFEFSIGNNMTGTIEGTLSGSTTSFGDQRVVIGPNSASMGSASAPNSPVVGSVGDIQGTSPGQFDAYGTFSYASGIFTPNPTSTATNYLFSSNGIAARSSHDTLPTNRGTTLWSISGGSLVGLNSNPGAVLLTLRSDHPITITKTVNVVCPEILNATLEGCYSCDQSASIVVFARSRCSAGSALVTTDGTYNRLTPSLVLETEYQMHIVKVHSVIDINSGTLTLSSGSHSDSVLVEGTLVSEDLIVTPPGDFTNTTTDQGGGPLIPFADWFAGLSDLFKGLLVTGMIIGGIIFLIVVIYFMVKGGRALKRAKMSRRLEDMEDNQKEQLIKKMEEESKINFLQQNSNDFK